MRKIIDEVFMLNGLIIGRVYLLKNIDGLTLIDTSIKRSAPAILRQVTQAGYSLSDVKRILITHAHMDHVGGLRAIKEATGARVIASAYERPYVEGKKPIALPKRESLPPLARLLASKTAPRMEGVPVDTVVTDGDVLPDVFGSLQVVATPGHTPGHTSFWEPERGILFLGDVVMNAVRMRLPFFAYTPDMAQNKRSLQRVVALKPQIVCFGHGAPAVRDAEARLRSFGEKVGAS
jgi:glyoxylase-like metal-dependent hydrolase (beta-lactamase superfamily II)